MRPWAVIVRRLARCIVVVALAGGCFTDGGGKDEGASAGTSTGGPGSTTADPTTTTMTTGAAATTEASSSTGTAASTSGDPGPCGDPAGMPLHATCTDESGCGCATGKCFVIQINGGWCSECTVDADCVTGGCSLPNPNTNTGAVCNEGGPGANCMSDAACVDPGYPVCGLLYEFPGVLAVSTCGQCASKEACPASAPYCAPDFKIGEYGGIRTCVTENSRADGTGCDDDGACASGHCGVASFGGFIVLPVCGACTTAADCMDGQTCVDGTIDPEAMTISGPTCM